MNHAPLTQRNARQLLVAAFLCFSLSSLAWPQEATVTEDVRVFRTYPFSDPDPVARMGNIYPYFRFQGYSMLPVDRPWKIVTLENPYIRVLVAPEIGGKILGAFEKATGRAFIYYNHVMKFREIAMRGPWTSGGIEFNFGDIGHAPTTATPVDYVARTSSDGSVSCVVGALDLPSRTEWRVEVRLPADKAMFETRSFWFNPTELSTSLYHWTNAAADADSTLQVLYPGNAFIGHGGEPGAWPVDDEGRDLSFYRNNAFGSYKSYHVLGVHTDFFGARWGDFGVIHWSRHADKPGKKLWIWGLSREGEIWKDMLTDADLGNTQYVEIQSGLHFNQAMMQSSRTPFKHMQFLPDASERFSEAWFPFKGMGGVTRATPDGVLEVRVTHGKIHFGFCPTGDFHDRVSVTVDGKTAYSRFISLRPLQPLQDSLASHNGGFEVRIGSLIRYKSTDDSDQVLQRPIAERVPFDWESAYGGAVEGRERTRQRDYDGALTAYRTSLAKDPTFLPSLSGVAELFYRRMEYDSAVSYAARGLAIDAYDPEANFLYGLAQRQLNRSFDASDGFGIAARSRTYRPAANLQLAQMAFVDSAWSEAIEFACRTIRDDSFNVRAERILAVLYRLTGDTTRAMQMLDAMLATDPLSHFARFERYRLAPSSATRDAFTENIRNEMPHETYLELAATYARLGLMVDAEVALQLAPRHPIVDLWQAYLAARLGRRQQSRDLLARALAASPKLVFPHRRECLEILQWAEQQHPHWKITYYLALLSWSLGRREQATGCFDRCGDVPDFAAFYLTRASFRKEDPERALADYRRALHLAPEEWRTSHALVTFLNERGRYAEALPLCVNAARRFPQSYVMQFQLARTLLFNKGYAASLAILDTLTILPSEGARYGRDAYRQACLLTAVEKIQNNAYDEGLSLIARARLWPERLGTGKPYDPDTRLEDYLEAIVLQRRGDQDSARRLLSTVAQYTMQHRTTNKTPHLIGALALRDLGDSANGQALLENWAKRESDNPAARWSALVFQKQRAEAQQLEEVLRFSNLNRSSGDQEFVLIADVVRMMSL